MSTMSDSGAELFRRISRDSLPQNVPAGPPASGHGCATEPAPPVVVCRKSMSSCQNHGALLPGPFPVARFRLRFEAEQAYGIRGYRGSAWRGIFGPALKRLVCITSDGDCARCLIRGSCTFPYVFETGGADEGDAPASAAQAPHPYIIMPEPEWRARTVKGESLEITLLGHGVREWPYVLHALRQGAGRGLGVERVPLRLVAAEQQDSVTLQWRRCLREDGVLVAFPAASPAIPPVPERFRIRLRTPLRVRRDQDLVEPHRLSFDEFVAALLRRLALLSRFHTVSPWRLDHAGLRSLAARSVVLEQSLSWQDWARYSSRQKRRIPMGGVVGHYCVASQGLEPLWPLLWLGQWTHCGKGAVMGLGSYVVEIF